MNPQNHICEKYEVHTNRGMGINFKEEQTPLTALHDRAYHASGTHLKGRCLKMKDKSRIQFIGFEKLAIFYSDCSL